MGGSKSDKSCGLSGLRQGLSVAQLSGNQSGPRRKQKAATYYVFLGCPASFDAPRDKQEI